MGRTCGEPNEIKRNTHPKTNYRFFADPLGAIRLDGRLRCPPLEQVGQVLGQTVLANDAVVAGRDDAEGRHDDGARRRGVVRVERPRVHLLGEVCDVDVALRREVKDEHGAGRPNLIPEALDRRVPWDVHGLDALLGVVRDAGDVLRSAHEKKR